MNVNAVGKVTITGEGQQSLDSLKASVEGVTAAQTKLNTSSQATAVVTDIVTKRQLSAADAYKRQTLAVVEGARAQDQYAKQVKIANDVLAQGKISAEAHAERVQVLKQRYGQASDAGKVLATTTEKLGSAFQAAAGAAAAFGLVLGVGALVQYGKRVFDTTANLQEQADQVLGAGGNVEAFQALHAVFLTNGISMEGGDKILARLTRSLGDAAEGSKKVQDAFHKLGLGSKELAGTTADAALPLIAQKLLEITDASKRASLEAQIFGKSGQQLESALRELKTPMDQLIQHAKDIGVVIDAEMIKKADEAKDRMGLAFTKLQATIAPLVTQWGDAVAHFAEHMGDVAKGLDDVIRKVQVLAGIYAGAKLGALFGAGIPGAVVGGVAAMALQGATQQQSSAAVDRYNAQLNGSVLSPSERAEIIARRDRALAAYNQGVGNTNLITNDRRNGVESVTVSATRGSAKPWAPTKEDIDAYNKIKETFAGFVAEQNEAARLAGESATQRETELAVIKGAQIAQKENNIATRDQVKNYADAVKYLGDAKTAQIQIAEAQKRINQQSVQDAVEQAQVNAGLATDIDHRELILKNMQDEIAAGGAINENGQLEIRLTEEQIKTIEDKNAAIQKTRDATSLKDYIANLKEEASLTGLSADERERQQAVLQAMHLTHGTLRTDQAQEIQGIIAARQETERWRQLVDGIAGSFQSFFEDVLNKGKLSFGSLWDAIKQQFVQMLAYMASQALIAPIIIPMVQSFAGSLGGLGGLLGGAGGLLGGSAGGGLLGSLGNLGSASSLFGGGGFPLLSDGPGTGGLAGLGGIGSSLSGLASSLGFATEMAPLATSATLGGGLGTISSSIGIPGAMNTGGLFGATTFGSFLGGAGLGSLAGSLVFGNKNDAGLGSTGGALAGAAIGSIIPGIGTLIGGLAGGLLGGGLGSLTGSSNQGAIANFSEGGLNSYLFKQGGGNNGQLSTQAAGSISQAMKTLQDAGVNVSLGNITGLSIGGDKSYVYDSAGGKQKLGGGDVEGVVNAILTRILPSATATNSAAQAILDKDGGLNAGNLQQVLTDLNAAQQFMDAIKNLSVGKDNLSDGAKALKQINDQIDPLIKQAQELGQSTDTLEALRSSAIASLVDDFNTAAQGALQQLTDPISYQLDQLMQSQAARFQSGQDIGADTSQLSALNNAELSNFLKGLSADQLTSLTGSLGNNPAYQAANAAAQAQLAAAQAAASLTKNLDDMTSSINAMEKQAANAADAARQTASNWASASDALSKSSSALLLTDQSLSPTEQYRNSRSQVDQLLNKARGGDVNSANDFASFAGQFLQTSFAYNGSTTAYQADRSFIQSSLSDLTTFSDAQQSYAQRQADSLDAAVSRLGDIVNAVQNQTSETSAGLASMAAGLDDLTAEVKASNLQSRMAA